VGYLLKVNIGGMWIYGRGTFTLMGKLIIRVVAILDLASDCLSCSQIVIHFRNPLGEICTSQSLESLI